MSDLMVILVLGILGLAAGWWRIRDARRTLEPYLHNQRLSAFAKSMIRHDDAQIFVAILAMIASFWLAKLSAGGLAELRRTAFGQAAPPRPDTGGLAEIQRTAYGPSGHSPQKQGEHELIACRFQQEALFMRIQDKTRSQSLGASWVSLPSGEACPHRGTYSLLPDGHITCSRHGRHPGLPSVYDMAKPGFVPWTRHTTGRPGYAP